MSLSLHKPLYRMINCSSVEYLSSKLYWGVFISHTILFKGDVLVKWGPCHFNSTSNWKHIVIMSTSILIPRVVPASHFHTLCKNNWNVMIVHYSRSRATGKWWSQTVRRKWSPIWTTRMRTQCSASQSPCSGRWCSPATSSPWLVCSWPPSPWWSSVYLQTDQTGPL